MANPLEQKSGLFEYTIQVIKGLDSGELPMHPDPEEITLGGPLTQDDINFIKLLRKEVMERFKSNGNIYL